MLRLEKFQREMILGLLNAGTSVSETARRMGVSCHTVRTWRDWY